MTGRVELPVARDVRVQVLVIGAGPAGVAAAIAAARRGCQVLVIEKHAAAGGGLTLGLNLTPVGFEPFKYWTQPTDPAGWAVQGIARQLHDRMEAQGAVCKPVWDAETCKWQIDAMLQEAGVQVLYRAVFVDAIMAGHRACGAIVWTAGGLWRIAADVCIDCSGDGDLLRAAGCTFDVGRPEDGKCQPMALVAMIGGLDLPIAADAPFGERMARSKALTQPALEKAWRDGQIGPTFTGILFPRVVRGGVRRDQAWARWVPRWVDPADPVAVAQAERDARAAVFQIVDVLRRDVAGCQGVHVLQTSTELWARASRRLRGCAVLDEAAIAENRRSADGIARGTGFLEIHSATPGDPSPEKGYEWHRQTSLHDADVDYDVPYGCLLPAGVDGLLVAGRCLSATHLAQSSARMQITCMATGEAAGAAAALAISGARQPADVAIAQLRQELVRGGARV